MKMGIRKWLKDWDEDRFDLTHASAGEMHPVQPEPERAVPPEDTEPVIEKHEIEVFQHIYPILACVLLTVMIVFLILTVLEMPAFGSADVPAMNEVTQRYVESGMEETGAVNVIAGVILDYRAFDTLGESHVLFTAVIAVFILLLAVKTDTEEAAPSESFLRRDPLARRTARILVPFIVLFGIYIILNGHLGPGGGFSGGAVIGAGLILTAIADGFDRLEKVLNLRTFRIVVLCALCFYSLSKCYSFFCGANGLESVITAGVPGRILSAGLILPLNAAVGIVVACTMYGFYSIFRRGRI